MNARRVGSTMIVLILLNVGVAQDNGALKTASENVPATTIPIEMIQLPPGKITLKDADGKQTTHDIKPVWISKTEITWDQYYPFHLKLDLPADQRSDKFDAENRPSKPFGIPHGEWGPEGFPAGRIHELAAKQYCAWLKKKTGKNYRLPTEAEWEYACRAGGPPVEMKVADLKQVAWFIVNSDEQTHEVAKRKPNAWGLYDMLGNVSEWVIGADGVPVIKGGSYQDDAETLNSTFRKPFDPDWQREDSQTPKGRSWLSNGAHIGFRIVRED
jgi:formylglycine-generating enzyme required for sulfatase activity